MKERMIISIVRSLIIAIVPTAIRLGFEKSKPKSRRIDQMIDNIDWDKEYERLLEEESPRKNRKARK